MATYLGRWKFSDATIKNFIENPQDRTNAANNLIQGFGGKMECYYMSTGEYDGLGIFEFPETQSINACVLLARSTGAFRAFEITPLITAKEAQAAMNQAKTTSVRYQAPNNA